MQFGFLAYVEALPQYPLSVHFQYILKPLVPVKDDHKVKQSVPPPNLKIIKDTV